MINKPNLELKTHINSVEINLTIYIQKEVPNSKTLSPNHLSTLSDFKIPSSKNLSNHTPINSNSRISYSQILVSSQWS